jgi:hypothetical protein
VKLNVANWERIARVVGGAILLVLAFTVFGGIGAVIAGILGGVFLVTGIVGYCPLWQLFKVDTRRDTTSVTG